MFDLVRFLRLMACHDGLFNAKATLVEQQWWYCLPRT